MPARLALATSVLFCVAPLGCGSITDRDGDDVGDAPSDDDDGSDASDDLDGGDGSNDGADDDGGDDPGDGTVEPTCEGASGTRLRQHIRRHSDGSAFATQRMRDGELGVDCTFEVAGDGSLRCLPSLFGQTIAGFASGREVFTGSDCASGQAVEVWYEDDEAPPTYAEAFEFTGSCQVPRRHYYQLGARLSGGPGQTLYAKAVSGCFPFTTGLADYHLVASELPVTAFVAGTARQSDTGRLTMTVIDAEDGARQCGEESYLQDDQVGTCLPMQAEDGVTRCLTGADELPEVTSGACTGDPVGVALVRDCAVTSYARELVDACGGGSRVHELAGAPGPVYGESCELFDEGAEGGHLELLGDVVDPSRFVPLRRGRIPAGDRLDRMASTTEAGLAAGTDFWFDRELGVECTFGDLGTGVRLCIPYAVSGSGVASEAVLYADEGCSDEVVVAAPIECAPSGQAPLLVMNLNGGDDTGDPLDSYLHDVGPRHAGPLYRLGEACLPVGADEALYDIGPAIPLDSLVSVVVDDEVE